MATVSTRPPTSRAETQRQVQSPLDQLTGYIRLYVGLEGTAVVLLYLSLWFWIGLFLDYGLFKMFGLDWVQVLPLGIRVALLCLLLLGAAALAGFKMVVRLMREFQPTALALVLERRFPELLGDRLITAVEMSDQDLAERYGYSRVMVEKTCSDAAERVARAPIRDVFNWGRLYRYGFAVVGVNAAFYLLVILVLPGLVAMFGGLSSSLPEGSPPALVAGWFHNGLSLEDPATENDSQSVGAFAERLGAITPIWFERNVLLRNVPWPRRAHLVVLDFPGHELKIGRNDPPVTLRVRALKWVVADGAAAEGWRPLEWNQEELAKLLPAVKVPEIPAAARGMSWRGSVDEVDLLLDSSDGRQRLDPDFDRFKQVVVTTLGAAPSGPLATLPLVHAPAKEPDVKAYREVLDQLQALASQRGMRRTLRKLIIPEKVLVHYQGGTELSGQVPLIKGESNEYTGAFPRLEESIDFTVQGEDYFTPFKSVLVRPAPTITKLSRNEEVPAYLYYRLADDDQRLKGLRQRIDDINVSLTGDVSSFQVPSGSNVEVVVETDKPLKAWVGLTQKSLRVLRAEIVEPTWRKLKALQNKEYPTEQAFAAALEDVLTPQERAVWSDKILRRAVGVRVVPRGGNVKPTRISQSKNVVRFRFENVRDELDFNFEFTDTDDVSNERHIVIRPEIDVGPAVEVQPEVVRKTQAGHYLVTPTALIPFSGKVRDPQGLSAVEYQFGYGKVQEKPDPAEIVKEAASVIPLGTQFAPGLTALTAFLNRSSAHEIQLSRNAPLKTFPSALRRLAAQTLPQVKAGLDEPLPERAAMIIEGIVRRQRDLAEMADDNKAGFSRRQVEELHKQQQEAANEVAELRAGMSKSIPIAAQQLKAAAGTIAQINTELAKAAPAPDEIARQARRSAGELEGAAAELHGIVERSFLREFVIDQAYLDRTAWKGEYFDVEPLGLAVTGENAFQPRYRLRIAVTARDTNVETGPSVGKSKEQFTLLVVSEHELLAEVGKEEEDLHRKLRDAVDALKDNRLRLEKILTDLPGLKDDEFTAVQQDAVGIGNAINKGGDVAREVYSDYRRILRELQVNRVQKAMIERVGDKVCDPLDRIRGNDFPDVEASLREFVRTLEKKQRDQTAGAMVMTDFNKLILQLEEVLANMAQITNINRLIAQLVELEKDEARQLELLIKKKKEKELEILKGLGLDP